MLWRSVTGIFLGIYFMSNAVCPQNSDNDFRPEGIPNDDEDFRDEDRNRFPVDDDDAAFGHGSIATRLGPFNISLETHAVILRLSWVVLLEDVSSVEPSSIEFQLSTNSSKINWIAFGFTKNNQFNGADWFVAWKSRRKRVYSKDCNSMKGVLHYDVQQDYDVISSRRPHSLNLTVRRALDTGDIFDVVLKKGKPTTLVWAYGMANKFSRIKHDIGSSWKSKEFLLFGKRGQEPSQKIGEIAENQNNHLKEKPTENKIKKNKNKDKKVKIKHNGKSNVSGTQKHKTVFENTPTESVLSQHNSSSMVTNPCTVIITYTRSWRDYFKVKERSVYYAILGSSAIMTGMLVLFLACCCRRKTPDPRKSKVSFYKVDDYDDEQIEFLKEKA